MHAFSLHWFRSKQRTVARFALAAFCLTWLQVAAMPCVMASGTTMTPSTSATQAIPAQGDMPSGMVMAPGEHCPYCPPQGSTATPATSADPGPDLCTFPHDPQVDSRVAFAATILAPPPTVVLLVPHEEPSAAIAKVPAATAPPLASTPLAVSYCRYLK